MDDKKKTVTEEETKGITSKETYEVEDFDEIRQNKKSESENKEAAEQKENKNEMTTDTKDSEKSDTKESKKKKGKKSKSKGKIDNKKNFEKEENKESEKAEKEDSKESEKEEKKDFVKEDSKDSEKEEKKDSEKEKSKESEKVEKKDSDQEESKDSEKDEKKDSEKEESKDSEKDEKKDSEKKESKESEKAEKKDSDQEESKDSEKDEKKDSKQEESKDSEEANKKDSEEEESKDSKKAENKDSKKEDSKDSKTEDDQVDFLEQEIITSQNPKPNKGKKILGITLGTVAAILLIAYISGFVYFSGHFYQDVAINGIPVSNMDKDEAKQVLDNFYTNYVLTVETIDGNQLSVEGKDISMQITLHNEFDSCIQKQEPYLWFINMFEHHDYEIGADAVWDEDALSDLYDSMDILNMKMMTAPKDAYVGIENGKFKIIKEVLGSTIKTSAFKRAVENSLKGVNSALNLQESGCYKLPSVYESDEALQAEYEAKDIFSGNAVKIQMDDLTLEPGMELYEKVIEKKGDTYQISKDLVKKYVEDLAKEYDTMETERTFTTSFSNRKVEVYGTAFGYQLNQEETTNALYKALTAGKPSTVEAVFDSKGYTLQGENDIGNTYVEVNLSEQRVIAYKNGRKIAEGDCVSGKESNGHGTCLGLYAIQDKLSPTVLRGERITVTKKVTKKNKKGEEVTKTKTTTEYEYESPVTFWLQFNGGYGLHDAAGWRSQYGGSIYYYSGSHGCVNMPYDLAETIYKNFEVGDPVIVYFWDNENRK